MKLAVYTLRFPFRLPPGQAISTTEQRAVSGAKSFSLVKDGGYYVLTIASFATEQEASDYANRARSGLLWVLLHLGVASSVEPLQRTVYAPDLDTTARNPSKIFGVRINRPVHGLIDGGRPAIYPTDYTIGVMTAGGATVSVTTPAERVLAVLIDGTAFPASATVIDDAKLRVGLELYGAYFTEVSENARLLTLVMALESLTQGTPRTALVLGLLERWKEELDAVRGTVVPDSDDDLSLESLRRELLVRREDSLRRQVRSVVRTTLEANGDPDAEELARQAVAVYDARSTLVHEGSLEPRRLVRATADAKRIVERVLKARFAQRAMAPPPEG